MNCNRILQCTVWRIERHARGCLYPERYKGEGNSEWKRHSENIESANQTAHEQLTKMKKYTEVDHAKLWKPEKKMGQVALQPDRIPK